MTFPFTESVKITVISGEDRYVTNHQTIRDAYQKESVDWISLVNGEIYPDTLSAYDISAAEQAPIVLTAGKTMEKPLIDLLRFLSPKKIVIIGGPQSVSNEIEKELRRESFEVERIAGEN